MYAVICKPMFWKEIEQAVTSKNEQIIYKKIDEEIELTSELERVGRLSVKHLIIDISSVVEDENKIIDILMRYRIINEKTQIIIIAPNMLQGNMFLHKLVSITAIYDILTPCGEDMIILPLLLEVIENPSSFKHAVRFLLDDSVELLSGNNKEDEVVNSNTEVIRSNNSKVIHKTVNIIQERVLGIGVIAVAGSINRIGTTHTVISLANFLNKQKYNVAVVEYHNSNHFNCIKNAYEDIELKGDRFILNGVTYYPYSNTLSLANVFEEDYKYVILDMGLYESCNLEEFLRANVRIITNGVKDWEIKGLEGILRLNHSIHKNKYVFNFSDKYNFENIKDNMDQLQCYQLPYNPNPFVISAEEERLYKILLKEILPTSNNKDKSNTISNFIGNVLNTISNKIVNIKGGIGN